jgi:phosphoribosylaminoimidazole carboxylase PurE protein
MSKKNRVMIILGSDSDLPLFEGAISTLNDFGISYRLRISSAHRTPERTSEMATNAATDGFAVIICGAGYAAHLAGVVAAHTTLPVIGVPIESSPLQGLDAMLSTAMMPGGIPVATMSLGKAGAKNAALFAVSILALADSDLAKKLVAFRENMKKAVEEKDATKGLDV